MIQKILNGYKLPEILEKYLGKKETGLFLDLAAYSLISENNAAQYYPSYAYSESDDMSTTRDFAQNIDADHMYRKVFEY